MVTLGVDVGTGVSVSLTDEEVTYHQTLVGLSGTGKSTAICNHVREAMLLGHGVIVLDPHGSLVNRILQYVPAAREEDVILLDIADIEYPFGLNVFGTIGASDDDDPHTLIVEAFKRVWGREWGINIATWLVTLAEVFAANGHGTLADVPRFFTDTEYRDDLLQAVTDDDILGAIRNSQDRNGNFKASEVESTYKRVYQFLRKRKLRNVVAQEESRFSFLDAMNDGKIVLISLKADKETVNLLGTIILGRIVSAAKAREEYQKPYCFVYVDEFQRFATDTFAEIVQETRKYNVALILATQSLYGLGVSEAVRQAALMTNTYQLFRLSIEDAQLFARFFKAITLDRVRPTPHPNPADELVRHPHPDPVVREAVDSLVRPYANVESNNIARYAYQGMNTYLRAMQERRIASGIQEIPHLKTIFYNLPAYFTMIYEARERGGEYGKQMQDRLEAYIETFCRIVRVNKSRSTLRPVLTNHKDFSQIKAIFNGNPEQDREQQKRYTRLLTDLYNLRWLGYLLAENPIPATGMQEPNQRDVARDLTNIPQGKAVVRPVTGQHTIAWTQPPAVPQNQAMIDRIRERSRTLYCTPRAEITRGVAPKIIERPPELAPDRPPMTRKSPNPVYDLPVSRRVNKAASG